MADILEMAVKSQNKICVNEREYELVFSFPVVAALEEKLGRSMKSAADWVRTQTKEVPDILEAGLSHLYPEEAKAVADSICNTFPPEEIEHVIDFLCVAACPKAMARLKEQMEKIQERVKQGLALPNVPGVDVP